MVVDDYAHHPTEVLATLKAAKKGWPDRRLIADSGLIGQSSKKWV